MCCDVSIPAKMIALYLLPRCEQSTLERGILAVRCQKHICDKCELVDLVSKLPEQLQNWRHWHWLQIIQGTVFSTLAPRYVVLVPGGLQVRLCADLGQGDLDLVRIFECISQKWRRKQFRRACWVTYAIKRVSLIIFKSKMVLTDCLDVGRR